MVVICPDCQKKQLGKTMKESMNKIRESVGLPKEEAT
jgi:hypothetical protein